MSIFDGQEKGGGKKPDRDEKGFFLPGNEIWRLYKHEGAPLTFGTPEELIAKCLEYFEWAAENPLKEKKVFGSGFETQVEKMRPLSINGFCAFTGITSRTWRNYRERPEFTDAVEWLEEVMFEQKFAGAAGGLMNANIIARELGLADGMKHTSPDGSMSPKSSVDATKLGDDVIEQLLNAFDETKS